MKYVCSFIISLVFSSTVGAEVVQRTFAAKIDSFTDKVVECEIDGKIFKVPRSKIANEKIKVGDAVLVTLFRKEFQAMLSTVRVVKK